MLTILLSVLKYGLDACRVEHPGFRVEPFGRSTPGRRSGHLRSAP
jgi:hypothetical protein